MEVGHFRNCLVGGGASTRAPPTFQAGCRSRFRVWRAGLSRPRARPPYSSGAIPTKQTTVEFVPGAAVMISRKTLGAFTRPGTRGGPLMKSKLPASPRRTVTRVDLAAAVYEKLAGSRQEAKRLVDATLNEIADALVRGEDAKFASFGSFAVRANPRGWVATRKRASRPRSRRDAW